jgi:hypothetical protein
MCCLGFLGLACGIAPEQLQDRMSPGEVNSIEPTTLWPDWLLYPGCNTCCSDECTELMLVNDSRRLDSEQDREDKIREIFGRHGIEVEFRDSPEDA